MKLLKVSDLHVGYYEDIEVLKGITVEAKRQEITSIIGPNGVGKSTLLKTVYGFLEPFAGSIKYQEESLAEKPPNQMPRLGISYVPQRRNVFPYMSVEENLQMGAWILKSDPTLIQKRLNENYERFPVLAKRKSQRAGEFSGGEQRMVEIGRALMTNPELLLIDEPSAGLAPKLAKQTYSHLTKLRDQEERGILLVDQNIRKAISISDYVYALELGENKVEGDRSQFEHLKEVIKEWF